MDKGDPRGGLAQAGSLWGGHVDDHQVRFVERIEDRIVLLAEATQLSEALQSVVDDGETGGLRMSQHASSEFAQKLEALVQRLLDAPGRGRRMTQPQSLAGRYLLVDTLGEGGMATVYRAFDQRLQVWRAIKILSPEYARKAKLRTRFETEAQTMALLEHRYIVRVYDVGHDGPVAYIVMELVEGGSLVDWLEAHGPMPARMAVEVMMQVCAGVQAAHDKGVIHRDIKPHNVMVTSDGLCRVTDFGIARVGDAENDSMTKTGAVMGTWGYMAPEQRTDAKHVDERADVYALACTFYTLLTDKSPMDLFAADPSDPEMQGIDEQLTTLILHAAEYRRDDRVPSVRAFVDALREALASLPPLASDLPPLARSAPAPLLAPDPTLFVPMTAPAANEVNGTIAPESAGMTLAPGTFAGGTPVSIPDRPSSSSQPPGRSIATLLFALLLLIAGLGAAATAAGIYLYTTAKDPAVVQVQPLPVPDPEPVAEADSGGEPEPAPKPAPVVAPTPTPRPAPTATPKPTPTVKPAPRPVSVPVVEPRPTVITVPVLNPEPAVVVVPEPEPRARASCPPVREGGPPLGWHLGAERHLQGVTVSGRQGRAGHAALPPPRWWALAERRHAQSPRRLRHEGRPRTNLLRGA